MNPLLKSPSLAGASVAHQRWRAHQLVLALAAQLDADRWASAACGVRLGRRVRHPVALVADGDPPTDGVLRRRPLLVVEFDDAGWAAAAWHRAGVATAWRLHDDHAEIVDEHGTRVVAAPGELRAVAGDVTLTWPLPHARRR